MIENHLINWLLEGDVNRDLLGKDCKTLQNKISKEGWGNRFLSKQNKNGHWGRGFYTPKWTSTHYTLLDLKNLNISPDVKRVRNPVQMILNDEMSHEKKISKRIRIVNSDICINGMVLNYASYFKAKEEQLKSLVDYLLDNQMPDGGYNCLSTRKGAVHSSLHTTLSVLEGLYEFRKQGYRYRFNEIKIVEKQCAEFILLHKLYKSDRTGKTIRNEFTRLPYPSRWRYDILRCLDFFAYANYNYDKRMKDALDLLISRRKKDGKWKLTAKYPGDIHFEMEKAGKPSRWNTLRSLRVLDHFKIL